MEQKIMQELNIHDTVGHCLFYQTNVHMQTWLIE